MERIQFLFSNLAATFQFLWFVFSYVWWILIPLGLISLAAESWKYYIQTRKLKEIQWVLLEIKIPREIVKSPEAMERVFTGLHGPYDPPANFKDFYIEPKIRLWYNFEIAGEGGEMRFYVYLPRSWRNAVEAQFYAQYPGVTVTEAEDYTTAVPPDAPNEGYDLWGMEVQFTREDAYPIFTYKDIEALKTAEEEEQKIDPLSAFAESLAKLRPGEHIWFQILARPCGPPGLGPKDKWVEAGKALVDKLAGREKPKAAPWWEPLAELFGALVEELTEHTKELTQPGSSSGERGLGRYNQPAKKDESKKEPSKLQHITPGEKDVIAAIERKISKLGYEAVVRIIYLARRDLFDMATVGSLFGMIKQFNTQHTNAFKPNGDTLTKKKDYLFGFVSSQRYQTHIKRSLLSWYKRRDLFWDTQRALPLPTMSRINLMFGLLLGGLLPAFSSKLRSKPIVLNTEELATLYHFPGKTVSSPMMPRMQAKPGEPPINLPVG